VNAADAFLSGLIDYAGLFPPENRDMEGAVAGYREARRLRPGLLNRFICPDRRLEELAPLIEGEDQPWPLSVIVTPDPEDWSRQIADRAVSLAVVRDAMWEVAHFDLAEAGVPSAIATQPALAAILASARTSLEALFETMVFEVPTRRGTDHIESFVGAAAEAGVGAKLRLGGSDPSDFPSPGVVARFIVACVENGVYFKTTAGLHDPIRHFDSEMRTRRHGFLNVVGASILAHAHSLPVDTVISIVEDEDSWAFELSPDRFRWRELSADAGQITAARSQAALGYGSCSFTEPVEHLRRLQII
jgi:hypothetical protein